MILKFNALVEGSILRPDADCHFFTEEIKKKFINRTINNFNIQFLNFARRNTLVLGLRGNTDFSMVF